MPEQDIASFREFIASNLPEWRGKLAYGPPCSICGVARVLKINGEANKVCSWCQKTIDDEKERSWMRENIRRMREVEARMAEEKKGKRVRLK